MFSYLWSWICFHLSACINRIGNDIERVSLHCSGNTVCNVRSNEHRVGEEDNNQKALQVVCAERALDKNVLPLQSPLLQLLAQIRAVEMHVVICPLHLSVPQHLFHLIKF